MVVKEQEKTSKKERPFPVSKSATIILDFANEEARKLSHGYIGTEHILLALLRKVPTDKGEEFLPSGEILNSLGITIEEMRREIDNIVPGGLSKSDYKRDFTPRSKKVLELAFFQARRLGKEILTSNHILLGLLMEGQGIACGALEAMGVSLDQLSQKVLQWEKDNAEERLLAERLFNLLNDPKIEIVVKRDMIKEIEGILDLAMVTKELNPSS